MGRKSIKPICIKTSFAEAGIRKQIAYEQLINWTRCVHSEILEVEKNEL